MDNTEFGNFTLHRETKVFFGKDVVKDNLLKALQEQNAKKILLVYGRGSIKKMGLYDQVVEILKKVGTYFELGGVRPNPEIIVVRKGVEICKKEGIDFVLAVGGGSTIDCSKAICAGAKVDFDVWKFYADGDDFEAKSAVPLGCILTLSATGTEMNEGSVISNDEKGRKLAMDCHDCIPKFSILDPTYTFSVNEKQTAAGSADILSHLFEAYFAQKPNFLVDKYLEGVMTTVLHFLPIVLKDPRNYEARANLMFASTMALNGLNGLGKEMDWLCHNIEHEWSAVYTDLTHGYGLTIVTIPWMQHISTKRPAQVMNFGKNVLKLVQGGEEKDLDFALRTVDELAKIFKKNKLPLKFSELGYKASEKEIKMVCDNLFEKDKLKGEYVKCSRDDVEKILKKCL